MEMQQKRIITDKKQQIQDIYNYYKEFNTDFVYQKDLEIVLTQISQKCIPLNVQHILQNMKAQQKAKLTFEEFMELMYQQDSQDINVTIQKQDDKLDISQENIDNENQNQQHSQHSISIKDELQKNSDDIEKIMSSPEKPKSQLDNENAQSQGSLKSQHLSKQESQKKQENEKDEKKSQNEIQKDSQLSSNSSQKTSKNTQQQHLEQNQQNGNSKSPLNKLEEDIDQKLEQKKSQGSFKKSFPKGLQDQQDKVDLFQNENQEVDQQEQKRRKSSIENSIKNFENIQESDQNSQDIMSKGSQNFFNIKKTNLEQNEVDPIQDMYEGQKFNQEDIEETNLNNFFSNNQSSVADNSQEISEDQIMEYKQILTKNQFPNHQNNCLVLEEYQVFYKDYIQEVFQKFETQENDNQHEQEQSHQKQKQKEQKKIFTKVNNFTSLMMDLFKDKIWILTHKFDREEFYSKTNGYKKLFQTIDNYFIKVKRMDPSTFKLTEALIDQEEFFKILEYWSSTEPQLYFSQEAPKYQNIDEEDELNYKSSLSLLSQVAQLRNNNSVLSQDEAQSARKELNLVKDLKKTIEKYKKMKAEAETDVEKKALNNIITDLERQLNQYNQQNNQNPHEIKILDQNYGKNDRKSFKQNTLEDINRDHHQSLSKKSIFNGHLLTKEEKRDKNLQVVYKFYCKQTYVSGKYATFDRVQQETNTMSMGKFFLFVRDFGIVNKNLKKNKLVEIFKKNSSNSKDLTFEEFKLILQKISEFHTEEQSPSSSKQIDNSKKDQQPSSIVIKTQESVEKKNDRIYKKQNSVDKFLQLEGNELDEYLAQKSSDTNPIQSKENSNQKLEQFYNFLCIDDQNKLKEKVRSPNLPFHTQAKIEQNLVNYKFNPQKYHEKQSEEIKELLKQRKEQKEKEKAQLLKKQIDSKELPQVSISKKFSKNASKKIQNEQEPIYGPTECTWESLLGNNYNQLRFLNQTEFKPTDLFDENSPEDDEYLEHYKIDYQNLEQQKKKEELLKKIEDYGQIKPKQNLQKEKSSIDTDLQQPSLVLIEQSNSYESSPQQIRTNKIFIRKNLSGHTRGKSQPLGSIAQQKANKSNNYIKIDHQNESGLKNQRNLSSYDVNSNYNYGQKNGQKDQHFMQPELLQQNSYQSINAYDIQPQSSYFQTPEKKIKLRESKSLQKNQQTESSNNKSVGNINLLRNTKDLNNSSVGDLIDFLNPITDRQKNIVQNQRQRITQIENASRQKEKEMIENLINNSQNNQNIISKKLSTQMPNRQNNFASNKKNQNYQ